MGKIGYWLTMSSFEESGIVFEKYENNEWVSLKNSD